jgi:hypothetical protein
MFFLNCTFVQTLQFLQRFFRSRTDRDVLTKSQLTALTKRLTARSTSLQFLLEACAQTKKRLQNTHSLITGFYNCEEEIAKLPSAYASRYTMHPGTLGWTLANSNIFQEGGQVQETVFQRRHGSHYIPTSPVFASARRGASWTLSIPLTLIKTTSLHLTAVAKGPHRTVT